MELAHPGLARLSLLVGLGGATGLVLWLWSQHGASVYLGYLSGFALTCF